MKNTTFRKKALLSSVAMLLVALVALGSATFAWFAANPNADASGLSLKTTAATGLVIKTDSDDNWSHNADLYKGQENGFDLQPVSQEQDNPDNFWTIAAADSGKFMHDNAASMSPATLGTFESAGYVYTEKVYFRLSDGSAATTDSVYLTGVTINKNATNTTTMPNAIRVAIADKEGNLVGTYAISTAGIGTIIDEEAQTKAAEVLTGTNKVAGTYNPTVATAVGTAGVKVVDGKDLSASADDETNFVKVYVYLDGQDANCYSDNVGTVNATEIISSINLDFKLKA